MFHFVEFDEIQIKSMAGHAHPKIFRENRTNPDISGHFDLAAKLRAGGSTQKNRDTALILKPWSRGDRRSKEAPENGGL